MDRAWRIARAWLWAPVWLPWMVFAHFWEWWHFGPSQRLLRSGDALDEWLDRKFSCQPQEARDD